MSKSTDDHALAIFKAGVAAVPVVGGSIASLIGDYIPTATQRSVDDAIDLLRNRLSEMEDRIDPDAVNKDEFSELFKTCYLTIVRTHQRSKLRAVAALITNVLLKHDDPQKLTYTELDHFARCVDGLSIGAIEVLGHTIKAARQRDRRRFGRENVQLEFAASHQQLPEMDHGLLMALLEELNSSHLVHLTASPSARLEHYANYPVELPAIGCRFATHVLQLEPNGEDTK